MVNGNMTILAVHVALCVVEYSSIFLLTFLGRCMRQYYRNLVARSGKIAEDRFESAVDRCY